MKLVASRDVCIGAGNCVLSAPDTFDQDDDGLVVLLSIDPDAVDREAVETAVQRCPSGALTIEES